MATPCSLSQCCQFPNGGVSAMASGDESSEWSGAWETDEDGTPRRCMSPREMMAPSSAPFRSRLAETETASPPALPTPSETDSAAVLGGSEIESAGDAHDNGDEGVATAAARSAADEGVAAAASAIAAAKKQSGILKVRARTQLTLHFVRILLTICLAPLTFFSWSRDQRWPRCGAALSSRFVSADRFCVLPPRASRSSTVVCDSRHPPPVLTPSSVLPPHAPPTATKKRELS